MYLTVYAHLSDPSGHFDTEAQSWRVINLLREQLPPWAGLIIHQKQAHELDTKQLPRDEGMCLSMQNCFLQHCIPFMPFVLKGTTKSKYMNGPQEDYRVLLWNDTVNAVPQCSELTVHLTLLFFPLPPCSRQPQPLEPRARYRPGAGRERQSTRGSCRWGSHCVWELKAGTGESETQCHSVSPQGESGESCARTRAGFSTVSRTGIERLFPIVLVDC